MLSAPSDVFGLVAFLTTPEAVVLTRFFLFEHIKNLWLVIDEWGKLILVKVVGWIEPIMSTQALLSLHYIWAADKNNRNELEGSIDKVNFVISFLLLDLRPMTSVVGKGLRMVEGDYFGHVVRSIIFIQSPLGGVLNLLLLLVWAPVLLIFTLFLHSLLLGKLFHFVFKLFEFFVNLLDFLQVNFVVLHEELFVLERVLDEFKVLLGKVKLVSLPVGDILHLLSEPQVLGILDVVVHGDSLSVVVDAGVGHISEVRRWLFLLDYSTSLSLLGQYLVVVQDFDLACLLTYDWLYRKSLRVIDERLLLFDLRVMHSHRSRLMITDMLVNIWLKLYLFLGYFWYLFWLGVDRLFHVDALFLPNFLKDVLLHLLVELLLHLSLQ